jgi:hypothetical protein
MNQHPPEYAKPTDRFAVLLQVGMLTGGAGPAFETLSYGLPGQPSPEMLLRRGHRAATWATEDAADAALKASAEAWKQAGLTFHHGKQIAILKLEKA